MTFFSVLLGVSHFAIAAEEVPGEMHVTCDGCCASLDCLETEYEFAGALFRAIVASDRTGASVVSEDTEETCDENSSSAEGLDKFTSLSVSEITSD